MIRTLKTAASLAVLIAAFAASPAAPASAETLYGVTATRDLIAFDNATPGTIATTIGITGLTGQSEFESVVAIDFRPATGQL